MAKKEERFEVIFRDGSSLKDEGIRQILVVTNRLYREFRFLHSYIGDVWFWQ